MVFTGLTKQMKVCEVVVSFSLLLIHLETDQVQETVKKHFFSSQSNVRKLIKGAADFWWFSKETFPTVCDLDLFSASFQRVKTFSCCLFVSLGLPLLPSKYKCSPAEMRNQLTVREDENIFFQHRSYSATCYNVLVPEVLCHIRSCLLSQMHFRSIFGVT